MMGQQNPALVIMAAGIGSRYAGGIKHAGVWKAAVAVYR